MRETKFVVRRHQNDPLHRFPAIRTVSLDEFVHGMRTIFGARTAEVPDAARFETRGNFIQLQDIALGFGTANRRTIVSFDECQYARLHFGFRGTATVTTGRQNAGSRVGQPCITSPYRTATLDYGKDYSQILLRINADALEGRLTALLGVKPKRKIEFEPNLFASKQLILGVEAQIEALARQLDNEDALLSPLVLRELEQALILQVLFAGQHTYSALLSQELKDAAPLAVRRTAEYIDANWNRPVTIEALVEISGVTARTLFRAFKKVHGCSPLQFAKKVRLRKARDMLMADDPSLSVTGVALACGFSNLGHFANDYRELFGELPSQTLTRGPQKS